MMEIDDNELYLTDKELYEFQGQPFSGKAVEHSPDGVLIGANEYVDGMLDGVSRVWYPSGRQLKEEEHFRRNSRHGPSREWFEDGRPKRDTLFEHSIRVSEKKWDESGNLVRNFVLSEEAPLFKVLEKRRQAAGK
jgi:antitoxin component YwqK of YwqJK toxin-antitoxin module